MATQAGPRHHRFAGRVALVTGAGSGIGRAVAHGFARDGGSVALFGRTARKLEAVAAELSPERALVVAGRHEEPAAARRAAELIEERWGRLDCLVNNAGTYRRATVAETDDAAWSEALATNLTGPFVMTRECLPHLRRTRGVIVNISSTLGLRPVRGAAAYSVAKTGLLALTRATALDEAQHGVRAVAVCPGVVDTPIHAEHDLDAQGTRAVLEEAAKLHPLGRVGTAEEVAALVLFLASDASAWTTGAVFTIDGGISLA